MGNCQAAEAATVVIQHPGSKIERIYWSVSASEVMTSNPGHYIALVVGSPSAKTDNGTPVKQLKLLRPDDTLRIGHVYRLITFEEVLKEFATKKCAKLGKLIKEREGIRDEKRPKHSRSRSEKTSPVKVEQEVHGLGSSGGSGSSNRGGVGRHHGGGGQWRPALQSIAEFGT